jgi:hypothetical protein
MALLCGRSFDLAVKNEALPYFWQTCGESVNLAVYTLLCRKMALFRRGSPNLAVVGEALR